MNILNFGSLNIDYVYHLTHFVSAGETISSTKRDVNAGGKGLNQSVAMAKSGLKVFHAGLIGESDSDILLDTLKSYCVNDEFIAKVESPSGHAIIQVTEKGENSIILFGGANQLIDTEYVNMVLGNFHEGDICVLQNEISCVDYIMEQCYKKGIKIILNPSPCSEKILSAPLEYVDYFLINEVEGEQISGSSNPREIIEKLTNLYPKSSIVLTLGKRGVMYKCGDKIYSCGIYENINVIDTTSAGDTFTGYFIYSIVNSLDCEVALKLASAASSIAVSKNGASISIPFYDEVLSFMENYPDFEVNVEEI